jgi:RNA polymerase sigma-70 factor, ECF subfamily
MTDRGPTPQTQGVQAAASTAAPTASPPPFEQIFEAEVSYVGQSLLRLGVFERDVEDLTHDVFLVVYRHLADYDPGRPLRPWLFGIAVRVALGYKRRAGHRSEVLGVADDAEDVVPSAEEQMEAHQARELVIAALREVDEQRRPVLIMHDIDECSMPEIAEALAIPLNTGYSRLRLARADLADAVKRLSAKRGGS